MQNGVRSMAYLLVALVLLTILALIFAPKMGFLLLFSTGGLLAYEYEAARYVLLFIVAMNVLIVLVLLGAALHSLMKKRISERSKLSETSDRRQHVKETEDTSPPEP